MENPGTVTEKKELATFVLRIVSFWEKLKHPLNFMHYNLGLKYLGKLIYWKLDSQVDPPLGKQ